MGEKSGEKSGTFKPGEDPRRGQGPAPGAPNAGRPPSEFRAKIREVLDRHDLIGVARDIALAAEKESDRLAAIRFLAEYGHGKPTQPIDLDPDGKKLTVRFVREIAQDG